METIFYTVNSSELRSHIPLYPNSRFTVAKKVMQRGKNKTDIEKKERERDKGEERRRREIREIESY